MSDNPIISVSKVYKSFKLPHEKNTSLKGALVNIGKKRGFEKQHVLNNISFEVEKGEFFGIVGRNGSGKSTLLKLLAGIYAADEGAIQVNGTLTPFIELGVGFNHELTGRENVFLNGALLGFNRKEMEEMYEDIVKFAELERFMDQKLKNYSSGMQVRLAFSIAIRAKSDILLVDEVLAVGDSSFQKKCFETFIDLKKQGRTIVFITHDMASVERFCDRVMVVHNSKSMGIFSPSDAAVEYDKLNLPPQKRQKEKNRWGSGKVKFKKVSFEHSTGDDKDKPVYKTGGKFGVKIDLNKTVKEPVVLGLGIEDVFGVTVAGPNSREVKIVDTNTIDYEISKLPLLPGDYKLTVALFDEEIVEEYDHLEKAYTFTVVADRHHLYGKVDLFGKWS